MGPSMPDKLTKRQIEDVCRRVYRRFPELEGVRPRVKPHGRNGSAKVVLLFKSKVRMDDGTSLPVSVRVVADERGKVIKMTSTR